MYQHNADDSKITKANTALVRRFDKQSGKIGWAILWLLGVPLPLLLIAYLIWGR